LFNLPVLNRLRLQDCGIIGALPTAFSTINDLRVDRNEFEGSIPSAIITSSGNALLALTGNYFNFGDLEDLVLVENISNLVYSPQRTRDEEENEAYIPGTDVTLTIEEEGTKDTAEDNVYQWYKDDIAISGANEDTYTIYNAQTTDSGVYYCIITNPLLPDLQIISANTNLTIDPSASINENLAKSIQVYPNPVSSMLYIEIAGDIEFQSVEIVDITGRLVLKTISTSISVDNLVRGIYTLKIITKNNGCIIKRILKD